MACFITGGPVHSLTNITSTAEVTSATLHPTAQQQQYLIARPPKPVSSVYLSSTARAVQTPETTWSGGGGSTWGNNGGSGWNGGGRNWDNSSDRGDDHTGWAKLLLSYIVRLAQKYNSCLSSSPLLTKAISACFLVTLADFLAQTLSSNTIDISRLARYALYGLISIGPQGHFWFAFLERAVTIPGALGVFTKVLVDQAMFSPISTALFFLTMKVAEGWEWKRAVRFVRENLVGTMCMGYTIWPAVNVINFWLVPQHYRIVFVSAVSVGWVAFLSLVSGKGGEKGCCVEG